MDALLGATLLSQSETVKTSEALAGKTTVLYFSASWCPPCRQTTPLLVNAREKLLAAGKPFEVVFVSSDNDQTSFSAYYKKMPWLALPHSERERKATLSAKYKVSGIPTLVVLNENGETITTNGRSAVLSDDCVETFPWIPKTVHELLGVEFVQNSVNGLETVGEEAIKGKVLVLYFSANWCGPCRALTPRLIKTYEAAKAKGHEFEVIFVSSCEDNDKFAAYFKKMPWLALPFSKRDAKNSLSERFEVEGIPSLVVVGPDGKVINGEARGVIASDESGEEFPWPPPLINDINEDPGAINTDTSLLLLLAAQDEERLAQYKSSVESLKAQDANLDIVFFVSSDPKGPVMSQLHQMGIPETSEPTLVMLDLPNNGAYYVTKDMDIAAFVKDFAKTERRQLEKK